MRRAILSTSIIALLALATLVGCGSQAPPADGAWYVVGSPDESISSVQFVDLRHGWATVTSDDVVLHTNDGGATWQRYGYPDLPAVPDLGAGTPSVGCYATDASHAWAIGGIDYHTNASISSELIMATDDGGSHWRVQRLVSPSESSFMGAAFADSRVGWVIGPGWPSIVLTTTDGGAHWDRLRFPARESISSICCVGHSHVWVFNPPTKVFSSTDGGHMWTKARTGLTDLLAVTGGSSWGGDLQFLDARNGWLVGGQEGSVLASTDGGHSWHRLATVGAAGGTHMQLGGIHFADRLHGWVIGSYKRGGEDWGYFGETSDGGRHWRPVPLPPSLRGANVQVVGISSLGRDHVWAVTEDGLLLASQRSAQESP